VEVFGVNALGMAGLLALGAWTAADATAFLQILVSQPLVAAGLAGWIAGDAGAGLGVGLLLQVLSMRALPLGGVVVPVLGPAAVVAGSLAASRPSVHVSGTYAVPEAAPLALLLLLALLLGEIGRRATIRLRERRGERVRRAEACVASDELTRIRALNAIGVGEEAVLGLLLTAGGLLAGSGLLEGADRLPGADPMWLVAAVLGVGLVRTGLLLRSGSRA
jgi:mannose/fructose/N-acetylgalactosamine-specific phosphotransferase system component IIC